MQELNRADMEEMEMGKNRLLGSIQKDDGRRR
jgi:ATP-dependent RNA helicase DDX23/PRP28